MPSKARKAFDKNSKDVKRLLDLHKREGGTGYGRRYGLEVLNKSAIVLITSYWEAYCEDLAEEALKIIVKYSNNSSTLPKELKKQISKELEKKKHELATWELADDGWRDVLSNRLDQMREQRNRKLQAPKTENIDQLFYEAVGVSQISSSWRWGRKMNAKRARSKLDGFIELRGSIAHRGSAAKSVKKAQVTDYFDFIKQVAAKTEVRVNSHVKTISERGLW